MKMIFTSAGPLNRWGLPARTNTSVTNSRAVNRRLYVNSALIGKYQKVRFKSKGKILVSLKTQNILFLHQRVSLNNFLN